MAQSASAQCLDEIFKILGAREMAQLLRVLAAFEEDLGSAPSTHTVDQNHPEL